MREKVMKASHPFLLGYKSEGKAPSFNKAIAYVRASSLLHFFATKENPLGKD